MTVAVIIVAAGRGRRLGGEIPKQYLDLGNSTAIRRSIERFLSVPVVTHVVPVIHPDDRDLCDAALKGIRDTRLLPAVTGGDTRAFSVRHGLERLVDEQPDHVLIHDAARPFVPVTVINDVIAALDQSDGACAALPVVDALWRSDAGMIGAPVSRDGLWRAQTPQGFRFNDILAAHRAHDGSGADDVAVAREAGLSVTLVPGSEQSYKITTMADLERARIEVEARDSNSFAEQ
jgi:2-C-methyl-D-erythritol 4-phosphate cytidylyltransferase